MKKQRGNNSSDSIERLRSFARKIIAVPKKEIEKQLKEHSKRKRIRNTTPR